VVDNDTLVDDLLDMAKRPDSFSQFELGEMILVAATEIIKLRGLQGPSTAGDSFLRVLRETRKGNGLPL
jgi:hypothetical protein